MDDDDDVLSVDSWLSHFDKFLPEEKWTMASIIDLFGFSILKTQKSEVIDAVLAGKDCLAVMPTDGGNMTPNPTKEMSHVAKFDGTNFQFWKFQITFLLEQHELIEIVTGVSTAPVPEINASTQAVKNSAAIKTWNQRDSTTRNFIVFTTV
ncbi:hypothetical protein DAPPUDRAFT_321466 [Daphnia pulex]|uniref:Retrotransposon Copia-like N-terminal domain-containing protein n=1 Tax=Daphnia pulex TaxID=6669 RepID=E9GTA2_DAPPU|nr:hypothetical protein DAPPUDRAFT_321466 [Daphnia pulex]|eukprot:EFX77244.1 hypothetical protein DAPPUDRAFT_321466 [Daphnia pulex]